MRWRGFFPFASIDWSAKGPRLAALVEAVQLRAPTILFIDDNPLNRAEAAHCVPGLQIRDETSIASMLDDALLRGKPDPEMKRLAQYQVLAQRQADQAQAAGDSTAFLRDSAITVRIEYDVGAHLDRAIELINRTNQLNFTKSRLSEDEAEARTALRALLGKHTVQAGLVHVRDRYGDYGFCGIYVSIKGLTTPHPVLLHFAFSCRILGMGIETWLYQHLKRPTLTVKGDVLTDVIADSRRIDWIGLELPGATTASASASSRFAYVLGRGGCDIRALLHYFEAVSGRVIEETNRQFNGIQVLSNSSLMAAYALRGASAELIRDAATLGFQPENFTSLITAPPDEQPAIWILNFIVELGVPMLRHKATGLLLPISLPRRQVPVGEILTADPAKTGIEPATLARLHQDFTAAGFLPDAIFAENMRLILAQAPPEVKIFIPLGNERHFRSDGVEIILHQMRYRNKIIAETAASFSNVHLLAPWDFMSEAEIAALETPHHYDRVVYFRMFQRILALCEA